MTVRGLADTDRWAGVTAVAFGAGGIAVLASRPGLLLIGVVAAALAAWTRTGEAPPASLTIERTIAEPAPDPEAVVTVRLSVTNDGETLVPDARVVDGVPDGLGVADDAAARHGCALRPGATTTFEYPVVAARGTHTFDPVVVAVRDASGSRERRVEIEANGDTTLTCLPRLSEPVALPLRRQTIETTGEVVTAEGGAGVAFHAVREYRRGDPLNRIDWNHAARTGELSTVEFQRERTAAVVVVIDAREAAYVAPTPTDTPALERSVAAAGSLTAGLMTAGNRVGLATLSPTAAWLSPGSGDAHRARVRELLGTHESLPAGAPETTFYAYTALMTLRRRLPAGAQVVLCSPLTDDYPARVARRLEASGHRVTVVAPDPTARADTPGGRVARITRALRIGDLREAGVRVIDWPETPLAAAIERTTRRWSR